jgi:hypothetical protein
MVRQRPSITPGKWGDPAGHSPRRGPGRKLDSFETTSPGIAGAKPGKHDEAWFKEHEQDKETP